MTGFKALLKRNIKLYFKDKGMFFTSLITPVILLVLYATFLSKVYKDAFNDSLSHAGVSIDESLINGCVGGELASSLLAVCCITVAFCSNMLMVQDKITGARKDITIAPVKRNTISLSYYTATFISTLIVCLVALGLSLLYILKEGWYLSGGDITYIFLDMLLLLLFGTALSSIINFFLSSQGQVSAVGTVVSAGYGFICGAYMPISNFSQGLRDVLGCFPGTYGTALLRNDFLRGTFEEMRGLGFPDDVIESIKDSVDCNIYFFGDKVETEAMYVIMAATAVILIGIYIVLNIDVKNRNN